ncbi:MAG: hypothetical protein ACI9LM_003624 [Alteromonadaceae bacterium]|jgi:hypothetical protein
MITSEQLIYKLELQSELLAKSLNLPTRFGKPLLAEAIYNSPCFNYLSEDILLNTITGNYSIILGEENLKYLMINEIEDSLLIEDLHQEIEQMALRLEERTIINISKLHTISSIYKLFGLEKESKYIVDAENIKLSWEPYFDSLQDQQAVLSSDFLLNDIPFRLIASKVQFDESLLVKLKDSFSKNLAQIDASSTNNHEEKTKINEHLEWLVDTAECLSNLESSNPDKKSVAFKINNQNYLVYGFPLSPHLSISENYIGTNINIHIKDTEDKQVFILNIECEKLVLECIFLNKAEEGEYSFSSEEQWIMNSILSRDDVCRFPLIFNKSYYLMVMRPYTNVDLLENSL